MRRYEVRDDADGGIPVEILNYAAGRIPPGLASLNPPPFDKGGQDKGRLNQGQRGSGTGFVPQGALMEKDTWGNPGVLRFCFTSAPAVIPS